MSPAPAGDSRRFLNVGCGDHPLEGFLNLDLHAGAEVQVDVNRGLPYENSTVHGIFSEHFIEHLTQAQGAAFFRECRRVLVNGGRVRVATPDLDFLVDVYRTDWRRNMDEWGRYGYEWIANRAEQLNLVMREWEHRWLYNEEELVRIARLAGLEPLERCSRGESSEPRLRGVEYREGSTLIFEFVKARPAVRGDDPLVSIVMTAFNPRYFESTLRSALAQTYPNIELVIGDDSRSEEIGRIVSAHADARVFYQRNPENLGEKRNLIECFARSRGEYIKFLNDDDMLEPGCVERMARCLNRHPDVTLVTSHRRCIDARGEPLPEIAATRRPVANDSWIEGVSLARTLLESGLNFIGEPSTTMFRRDDLTCAHPNILSFAGRECIGTVDVTMWTHLLSRGDGIYLTGTLSSFRMHPEQAQRSADYRDRQAGPARRQILFDARRMGLLERTGPPTLTTRSLAGEPEVRSPRSGDASGGPRGPRVSIVIPVWNKLEYTRKCLEAIRAYTPAGLYELVIVDNGSTDATPAELAALPAGTATVLRNDSNLGFSRACNQGARAATCDYLLFLNNDTEPRAGWLEPLIRLLDSDPAVGGVGSKLLYPDGTIQHAGVVLIEDRSPAGKLVAWHLFHRRPGDAAEVSIARTYQALTAACLMVRKSAFDEVGGFDEQYWNGYEDVDFCLQLGQRNWKLVYEPRSVLLHYESVSGPERFRKADENVRRLQQRWRGKIVPDAMHEPDGTTTRRPDGPTTEYHRLDEGRADSEATAPGTLASIVILTWNQLRTTQECVASIQRNTPELHEIVFVDNGSTDGTVKWLRRQAAEHPHYRVIENSTNLGFAKGSNQGIRAARGEYTVLLNNDVVVTPGWLGGMLECLAREPEAGFVGPMTNCISGPQQVPGVEYRSPASGLDEYASAFRERNRGRRIPQRRLVGFCLLFRSELVRTVGLLDEAFGTGNFEDDDLCLRAAVLGRKNVIAGDVFIHHHGSRTFIGNRVDHHGTMAGNRRRFRDKWETVDSDSPLAARLAALRISEIGWESYLSGQRGKAVEALVEGMRAAPGDGSLSETLVRILIDSGSHREALDLLNAGAADGWDAARLVLSGRCQERLGLADEAEGCADRALAIEPESAAAFDLKGRIAHRRGDRESAAKWWRRACDADPGLGEPSQSLALLEWAAGRRDVALELAERAFALSPCVTEVAEGYHQLAAAAGAWERASRAFAEARALHPSDRRVAFYAIESLLRLERHAEAMERIEGAMLEFGIDDGILAAALEVRAKLGPHRAPGDGKGRAGVSLCMIVRNEERDLARCLASAKAAVAEMIVVDTGSTDRTIAIATAFGAQVFQHPWTGDFSEARNLSLSKAAGEWILILDADERFALHDLPVVAELARKSPRRAWSFVTRNYVASMNQAGWTANDGSYLSEEAGSGWIPSVKARLFPNRPGIRFSGRVHEGVEEALQREGIPAKPAPIPVHHYGKLDAADDHAKGEEYFELGLKKIEELGDDVIAISELAIQARALGRYEDSVELWRRVLRLRPEVPIAWFNLGSALLELKRFGDALSAAQRAFELNPGQKEIVYNYAMAELYAGDVKKSVLALEGLLRTDPDYPPASALLAAAWCCAGRPDAAAEAFAALRARGFDVVEYVGVVAENLASAGRGELGSVLSSAAPELAGAPRSVPQRS